MRRIKSGQSPYEGVDFVESVSFTIGAETGGNTKNVSMQFRDADQQPIAARGSVFAYLSTNVNGDNLAAAAPSGGVAVGGAGVAIPLIAGKAWGLISNAAGVIDVNLIEAAAATWYLVVVLPDGRVVPSAAITFV